MRILPIITAIAVSFLSVACSTPTPPPGVTVVSPFDVQRYLGTWYEIARFDHPFESGLEVFGKNLASASEICALALYETLKQL